MKSKSHYETTKEYHRISAVDKNGYYQAMEGKPQKHSIWQLKIRNMVLNLMDKILSDNSDIASAIDAGCGKGDFTIEISKRYPQLKNVYGCDFVKEALDIAQRDSSLIDNISFQNTELLHMPFTDNSIDLTLCINVLHHVYHEDLGRTLSELARITNKYLIVEIKNIESIHFNYICSNNLCGMNIYPTSAKEVSNLLKDHSFSLVKTHGIFLFNLLSPLVVLLFKKDM